MRGTADILGHDRTVARLWEAVERDRLHHAYLFEGRAGLGKALVARRLALAANCTDPHPERPCGVCPTCTRILAGTHPDVLTLEPEPGRATLTITVDQVREVVRKAGYHRYDARKRFILVDPADAMAAPAANALLKTLEEPPAGTHFALVTARASALLPTIRSRCQRVRFSAVPESRISSWLSGLGLAEADRCARLSQGRPGAALALAEGGLAERTALRGEVLGALGSDLGGLNKWTTDLVKGGRAAWTPRVEAVLEIVEDLLRDAVVVGSEADEPLLNEDLEGVVLAWAGALWPGGAAMCHRALADTREALAANANGRLAMDALLARLATELGRARAAR